MKWLFIRHGETEDNLKGVKSLCHSTAELTPNGISQAHQIAKQLKKYSLSKIYSSPTKRTEQTAKIIAAELKVPMEIKDDLRERNWGDFGSKTWEEVSSIISKYDIQERYTFIPPRGESWQQMEKRLLSLLKEVSGEDKIAFVTHTGCLRALIPALKKISKERHEEFSVKTGSITLFCTELDDFEFIGFRPEDFINA